MKRDRKPVRLIPNGLNQVQYGRETVQHDRFVLLTQHVDDLLTLGDRS